MPITKRQFELGINLEIEDWMKKIHAYLSRNEEEAFTGDEIFNILQVEPNYVDLDLFKTALDKLEETRAIESRLVNDEWYYALGPEPFDL